MAPRGPDIPLGADVDEEQDAAEVQRDAAAAADDRALVEAGLLGEGDGRRRTRGVSLAHRLYNGEAGLDVVGRSKLIYQITAVVVLLCLASMFFRGFNFGIDFAGGNSFRVPGTDAVLEEVRTAAADAGADKQLAEESTLKAEDFPEGWTSEPGDQDDTDSGCPDWENAKQSASARVDSDEFAKSDTTQVINTVYIYADDAGATEAFKAIGNSKTRECFAESLAKQLTTGGGVEIGEITDKEIDAPSVGDEVAAGRLTIPIKAGADSIDFNVDLVFARAGRGVQLLGFMNAQDPFDDALREELTKTATERLAGNL